MSASMDESQDADGALRTKEQWLLLPAVSINETGSRGVGIMREGVGSRGCGDQTQWLNAGSGRRWRAHPKSSSSSKDAMLLEKDSGKKETHCLGKVTGQMGRSWRDHLSEAYQEEVRAAPQAGRAGRERG